jgi:hypothetical protein
MLIEQLLPQVIGGRKNLKDCLIEEARIRGVDEGKAGGNRGNCAGGPYLLGMLSR